MTPSSMVKKFVSTENLENLVTHNQSFPGSFVNKDVKTLLEANDYNLNLSKVDFWLLKTSLYKGIEEVCKSKLSFCRGDYFLGTNFSDCSFPGALKDLNFSGGNFSNTSFIESKLENVKMRDKSNPQSKAFTSFKGVKFHASEIKDSKICNANFTSGSATKTTTKNTKISDCDFSGFKFDSESRLENLTIKNVDFSGASFSGCLFNEVHFESCIFDSNTSFKAVSAAKTVLSNCRVAISFEGCKTTEDLNGITLHNCDFIGIKPNSLAYFVNYGGRVDGVKELRLNM